MKIAIVKSYGFIGTSGQNLRDTMQNLKTKLDLRQKLLVMQSKLGLLEPEIELHEIKPLERNLDTVIAIDGSFLPAYTVDIYTLVIFRIAIVMITASKVSYDYQESSCVVAEGELIDDNELVQEAFKLSEKRQDQITNIMEMKERSCLRQLAETTSSNVLFLVDGSFEPLSFSTKYKGKSSFLINEVQALFHTPHIFAAISKKSTLSTINPPHLDEYVLASKGEGYIEIEKKKSNPIISNMIDMIHLTSDGTIHLASSSDIKTVFARFPGGSQFHRVDIINADVDEALSNISQHCHGVIPGYPTPLTEAHRYAKFIRDMQQVYICAAKDAMAEIGIEGGKFCNEIGLDASLHDDLDQVTKWE